MECIYNTIAAADAYKQLLEFLRGGDISLRSLCGVTDTAKQHVLNSLKKDTGRTVFYVLGSDYAAKRFFENDYSYADAVYLPAPVIELRTVDAKGMENAQLRMTAISKMLKTPSVVILSDDALLYKMRPKNRLASCFISLKEGDTIDPSELMKKFADAGYYRTGLIEGKGQMSGRGEIAEIFPPDREYPIRITFFDDEIESIRHFDTDSQRSFGAELKEVSVPPAHEMLLIADERKKLADIILALAADENRHYAERYASELMEFGYFDNIEAFSGEMEHECVFDYVDDPIIIYDDIKRITSERERRREDRNKLVAGVIADGGAPISNKSCYAEEAPACLTFSIDMPKGTDFAFSLRSSVEFAGNVKMLARSVQDRLALGWAVYMLAGGKAKSISSALLEEGVSAPITKGGAMPGGTASAIAAKITAGFEAPEQKAYFLSELELFGTVKRTNRKPKKKKADNDLFADLNIGDVVVHDAHGKGRYLGLKSLEVGGVTSDYMEIEYRGGDKLYIKTEQIERVQKYVGPGEENVTLSKLGGKEWDNAKSRARSSVKQLAEDLVALYREREHLKGHAFSEDTVWQREFEDSFEYEETDGQLRAIEQIKQDMESERIMDRLLQGDVGYGKTEVAMRACFKAVMDSKQVAMLVPTTLLARQHYATFKERFSGFPIEIAMLSRFTKKSKGVIEDVNSGKVDIVIGTHKLLSKELTFKNLGLLIVDEEQRFGVSHKERIKNYKKSVDVLTLTATPIPRTMEMALTGIRDMSVIDTPPQDRKEVRAFVSEFSWGMVKDAVLSELNRGGQVYFVCRLISQTETLMSGLKRTVPEARVAIAHGQMSQSEFERVISAFYEHEFDVLICTTIVESGIDIPSANTIIIYEADKFGLSQLYQLKGRVGRSAVAASAYFTYISDNMSELAQKRLAAISEFTKFGSGFKIAMRDLEIRGAGNILGAEQSGHMTTVGYSLYCTLVKEQVDSLLGRRKAPEVESTVEIGRSAFIPSKYIPNEGQRLDMYRAIGNVKTTEQAKQMRAELKERYGTLPRETETLIVCSLMRAFAKVAGVSSVINKNGKVEIKLDEKAIPDYKRLFAAAAASGAELKLTMPPMVVLEPKKGGLFTETLSLLVRMRECVEIVPENV